MITQKTQIIIDIEGKSFIFQCEPNSTLEHGYQALEFMRNYYLGRLKEFEDQRKKSESVIPEENKPEGENGDQ